MVWGCQLISNDPKAFDIRANCCNHCCSNVFRSSSAILVPPAYSISEELSKPPWVRPQQSGLCRWPKPRTPRNSKGQSIASYYGDMSGLRWTANSVNLKTFSMDEILHSCRPWNASLHRLENKHDNANSRQNEYTTVLTTIRWLQTLAMKISHRHSHHGVLYYLSEKEEEEQDSVVPQVIPWTLTGIRDVDQRKQGSTMHDRQVDVFDSWFFKNQKHVGGWYSSRWRATIQGAIWLQLAIEVPRVVLLASSWNK